MGVGGRENLTKGGLNPVKKKAETCKKSEAKRKGKDVGNRRINELALVGP